MISSMSTSIHTYFIASSKINITLSMYQMYMELSIDLLIIIGKKKSIHTYFIASLKTKIALSIYQMYMGLSMDLLIIIGKNY